jgi:predicted nucleotide-binding protein
MEPRVIIEHRILPGSDDSNLLQQFATVYLGTTEYRVYAPAKAKGDVRGWMENCSVRLSNDYADFESPKDRAWVLEAVQRELARSFGRKELTPMSGIDPRKVFVVHGRNAKAREAVFTFLSAIDLAPLEWEQVVAATGKPNPFIGEALEAGFSIAQAAVVILTGDDVARVGKRYLLPHDPTEEKTLRPQPRPNVLFEAGMALGKYPNRTVLISIGSYRKFSDIDGRHIVHLSNDVASRQALAERLKLAGCGVVTEHKSQWHTSGNFDAAVEDADLPVGREKGRLKTFRREYKFAQNAQFKRKIWIELRNETDECLILKNPRWRNIPSGIHADIRQGTFQLQIGNKWCPEEIGTSQLTLPPGELCRLWAAPDDGVSDDEAKKLCRSETPFGSLVLFANEEEITIPV